MLVLAQRSTLLRIGLSLFKFLMRFLFSRASFVLVAFTRAADSVVREHVVDREFRDKSIDKLLEETTEPAACGTSLVQSLRTALRAAARTDAQWGRRRYQIPKRLKRTLLARHDYIPERWVERIRILEEMEKKAIPKGNRKIEEQIDILYKEAELIVAKRKGNIGAETKDLLDGSDIDKEFARILGKTSNDLNNRLEDFRHGRLSGVTFAVMTNWEALKGAIDSLCYGSENIFVPLKKVDKGQSFKISMTCTRCGKSL